MCPGLAAVSHFSARPCGDVVALPGAASMMGSRVPACYDGVTPALMVAAVPGVITLIVGLAMPPAPRWAAWKQRSGMDLQGAKPKATDGSCDK